MMGMANGLKSAKRSNEMAQRMQDTFMAQDRGLVQRGLIMLGFMLALVTLVLLVLWRRPTAPEQKATEHPELVALSVPNPGAVFPAHVNWAALAKLSEMLSSSPGWEIRYNAAIALARRGSVNVPLDILASMLDEQRQMRNFRAKLADGTEVADEVAARRTVLNALQAVMEWHKFKAAVDKVGKDNPAELRMVYAAIECLVHSSNAVLKEEAEKAKKELGIK
jgi:hypothetical protein